jgi:cysteine desulfurase
MLPYLLEHFGNPSSSHVYGRTCRQAVETARSQVARLLGCRAPEVIFTSGGSEANNWVIKGIAGSLRGKGSHIVTSAVEHPAVLEPCEALSELGFRTTLVPVEGSGRVSPAGVEKAITPGTILITIMHANNEVGTIQPIEEIGRIAREHGILFHTDAAQTAGKIPVDVDGLGVDFLSLAGHKLHAPKGIGALYIREGRDLPSLIHGAGHEGGRRAGTENVLEIVGLGRACELAVEGLEGSAAHCRKMRDRLWEGLSRGAEDLRRNGSTEAVLPNTLSVSFRGVDAGVLLSEIGDRVAASAGAACHGPGGDLSAVMKAMDVPAEYAMGTVRFSVGKTTRAEEIDATIGIVSEAVGRLRA